MQQQAFVPQLPLRTAAASPAPLPPKPSLRPRRSRPVPVPTAALSTLRADDVSASAPCTPQSPAEWLRAHEQTMGPRDALRVGYRPPGRTDPASAPTSATPSPAVSALARHAVVNARRSAASVADPVSRPIPVPAKPRAAPPPPPPQHEPASASSPARSPVRHLPAVLRVASFSHAVPASPPSYCHVTPDLPHLLAQLRDRVHYLGPVTRNKVVRAIDLARSAGASPAALSYNVAVALVVADLQMDCDTVCAALLRGLIARPPSVLRPAAHADCPSGASSPTLSPSSSPPSSARSSPFGSPALASIPGCAAEAVERDVGADVTRILRFHGRLEESVNLCVDASFTEMSFNNLRELVLVGAMGEHRAISLELARAVLAMRSVDALPDAEARTCMARRSMYLYAPLANQLGIYFVQSELEELSFMYLQPEQYLHVRDLVGERRRECEAMLTRSKDFLERVLSTAPEVRSLVRSVQIKGRVKGLHSVYRKMRRSGKQIDEIYDLLALRVVVHPKKADDASEDAACYAVAELIRQHYDTLESRGKDYIAEPKRNGYRSLHMTVLPHSDSANPLEIQIRSEKMHHVAEFGAAAHWIYKEEPDDDDAVLSDFDSDNDNDSHLGDFVDELDVPLPSVADSDSDDHSECDDDAFSPFSMEEDLAKPPVRSDISPGSLPRSLTKASRARVHSPRGVQVDLEEQQEDRSLSDDEDDCGAGARTIRTAVATAARAAPVAAARSPAPRRRRGTVATQYPRPRVAVAKAGERRGERSKPTSHEARMSELVSQRLSTRSRTQHAELQDQLRGGYVACLASAIRASRVIVAVAGQVYGLAVGSTLLDLARGLGVASLGAVAVVNGSVAPLTQRLEMNDIVWFVQA